MIPDHAVGQCVWGTYPTGTGNHFIAFVFVRPSENDSSLSRYISSKKNFDNIILSVAIGRVVALIGYYMPSYLHGRVAILKVDVLFIYKYDSRDQAVTPTHES